MGNREIEIAIHGTNGGYRTITRDPVAGLFDARRDYSKVASMGSEAYSIHFREGCVIFSKYKIVRDVLGDSRTGNIAFSVIVPIDKKFEIADVKSLLDRVDTEFSNKEFSEGKTYIKNNNLGAVRNDWAFLDKIKEDYEPKFRNNPLRPNTVIGGGKDEAAFVYYSTAKEFETFFGRFDLKAYNPFKQVFFVKTELKDEDKNPLNALRHSENEDLTDKVKKELKAEKEEEERRKREEELERIERARQAEEERKERERREAAHRQALSVQGIGGGGGAEVWKSSQGATDKGGNMPRWVPLVAALFIFAVGVVAIMMLVVEPQKRAGKIDFVKQQIDDYVRGNELLPDTLSAYFLRWERLEPKLSSSERQSGKSYFELIETAKQFRELINNLNFELLIDTSRTYPNEQNKFEKAVKSIDSAKYDAVKSRLGKVVAKLPLYAIADSINTIIRDIDDSLSMADKEFVPGQGASLPSPQEKGEKVKQSKFEDKSTQGGQQAGTAGKSVGSSASAKGTGQSVSFSKPIDTVAIVKALKSGDIKQATLKKYYQETTDKPNLNNSVKLALEIWEKSGEVVCDHKTQFATDENLKGSRVLKLVEDMCGAQIQVDLVKIEKRSEKNITELMEKLFPK